MTVERISSSAVTPGLSAAARTSEPESVTADMIFFFSRDGGSSTRIVPSSVPPVVDILFVGACRSMMRAPAGGIAASGTLNVVPKRPLNRIAMSRISSRCWRWSSPTGTRSPW